MDITMDMDVMENMGVMDVTIPDMDVTVITEVTEAMEHTVLTVTILIVTMVTRMTHQLNAKRKRLTDVQILSIWLLA